jgi:predicted membrane channel-forming protein YqfA (hemolysin III family)
MFSTKLIHPNQEIEYEIAHSPVKALKHSYDSNLRRARSLDLPRDAFERRVSEEKFRSLKEHLKRFEDDSIASSSSSSSDDDDVEDDDEEDDDERIEEDEDEISLSKNGARRRRRRSSRKSSNTNNNNNTNNKRAPSTKTSSKSSNRRRRSSSSSGRYRFPLSSLIDFRKLGRHKRYADLTMSRPLMRGWLHCLLASVGYPILIYNNKSEWFRMHPRTFWLMMCTLVPYTCSTFLHFIPWKSRFAHDVALSADFLGISFGFTSHTVLFSEKLFRGTEARIAICATTILFLMQILAFRQKQTCVMKYMRRERFLIFALNIVLLMITETKYIHGVSWKTNVAIQFTSKFLSPFYFVYCTRMDCKRRSPLTIPGIWCAHENWHLMIFANHLMQIYAMIRLVGDYCPENRACSDVLSSWG